MDVYSDTGVSLDVVQSEVPSTMFVSGSVFVVSSDSPNVAIQAPGVSPTAINLTLSPYQVFVVGDTTTDPHTKGSAYDSLDQGGKDSAVDTMEDGSTVGVTSPGLSAGDNAQDESVTLNEETLGADLVSDQKQFEQERLLKEYEDKKRSSDLAQELQAKYDSEFQNATTRYVSTLPIAR